MKRAVLILVFVVALVASALAYWTWTSEMVVEYPGFQTWYHSLAFSPTGDPAVAFIGPEGKRQGPAVIFATRTNGAWRKQIVDPSVSGDIPCGLAFSPDTGLPWIAYGGSSLRVAEFTGSAWRVVVLDANQTWSLGMSLAFSKPGANEPAYPAIAYSVQVGKGKNATTQLRYASREGGSWAIHTVDTGPVWRWSSLAFDPSSRQPTIAYSTTEGGTRAYPLAPWTTLRFAWTDESGWHTEVVSTTPGSGQEAMLAYDNGGIPALVDRAGDNYNYQDVRYFRRDGQAWSFSVIPIPPDNVLRNAARPRGFAFDPDGQPLVAYQHGGNYNELIIARLTSSVWDYSKVVSSTNGVDSYSEASFALNNDGWPAVVYVHHPWSTSTYYLKFAQSW
jgi:hypothetical protein